MARALALSLLLAACEAPFDDTPRDAGSRVVTRPPDCLVLPDVDFGEVIGTDTRRFKLTNGLSSPRPIRLGSVDAPFNVAPSGPVLIPPFDSVTLRLGFESADALTHMTSFEFIGGEDCAPQTVQLRALGGGRLEVPTQLDLGSIPFGQVATRALTILNTRRTPIDLTLRMDQFPNQDIFDLSTTAVHVEPGSAAIVEVSATPRTVGRANAFVQVIGDDVPHGLTLFANGGTPRVTLPPQFDIEVPVMPDGMVWGQRLLQLRNEGDGNFELLGSRSLTISSVAGSNPFEVQLRLETSTAAPGATMPLTVTVNPMAPLHGTRSWDLTMASTTTEPLRTRVSATFVDFAEVCETLAVSPDTVALPALEAGVRATAEVRFSNTGRTSCVAYLDVDSIATWRLEGPSKLVIPPGATETVQLSVIGAPPPFNLQRGVLFYRVVHPARGIEGVPLSVLSP